MIAKVVSTVSEMLATYPNAMEDFLSIPLYLTSSVRS